MVHPIGLEGVPSRWAEFKPGVYLRKRDGERLIGRVVGWEDERFIMVRWGREKTSSWLAEMLLPTVEIVSREAVRSRLADPSIHLAMKWHYNDARYRGICTWRTIRENRKNSQSWCSQSCCWELQEKRSPSPLYGLDEEDLPCDEAKLFSIYSFSTGGAWLARSKNSEGKNLTIAKEKQDLLRGKLAFMTTRELNADESDRYVFGLIQIAGMGNVSSGTSKTTEIRGMRKSSLYFDDAVRPRFWRIYHNRKRGAKWGQGLFRYLDGPQTEAFLEETIHLYEKLAPTETRRKHLALLQSHLSAVRKVHLDTIATQVPGTNQA